MFSPKNIKVRSFCVRAVRKLSISAILVITLGVGVVTGVVVPGYTQVPACQGQEPTIIGTAGDDLLDGTYGDDVISGLGGNDEIVGLTGDDIICGGDGDDAIFGGSGNDSIDAEKDFDVCIGGDGSDTFSNCEFHK
ncbi:MAG: calcium-binding protein [Nitrososphaerales archaeon]